jgi:hypothetical protein
MSRHTHVLRPRPPCRARLASRSPSGRFAIYRRRRDRLAQGDRLCLGTRHGGHGPVLVPAGGRDPPPRVRLRGDPPPVGLGALDDLGSVCRMRVRAGSRRIAARMAGLYWQGLTVAGVLTLLPGRVLNEVLFAAHRPSLGSRRRRFCASLAGLGQPAPGPGRLPWPDHAPTRSPPANSGRENLTATAIFRPQDRKAVVTALEWDGTFIVKTPGGHT